MIDESMAAGERGLPFYVIIGTYANYSIYC